MKHHYVFLTWRNLITRTLWISLILLAILVPVIVTTKDFYELLGIERDASHKDIRRAFKKLALSMHPDKNMDDPKAHDKFVEINRAYEVLKDDDLRNKYDRFGEEGLKDQGQNQWNRYESWQFYKTEFGLYDEDPEIVTLSKTDFEQSVFGEDIWFVNYYSPRCHHCHDLAPTWREFAKEMEGVIRIGAVNCWDDNPLCTQQGVVRYPTLKIYPANEEFTGTRKLEFLVKHALRLVSDVNVHALWTGNFKEKLLDETAKYQPWVISYCGAPDGTRDESTEVANKLGCLDADDQFKLAAILKGVVNVAAIDCVASAKLCEKLAIEDSTIKYYSEGKKVKKGGEELELDEPKHIATECLKRLPDITTISAEDFEVTRNDLKSGTSYTPMLTYFTQDKDEQSLELRKLPPLLRGFKVGKFNCTENGAVCNQLYLTHDHLPKVALFREGGEYELHHGRLFAQDIAAFGKQSRFSKLHMLSPADFPDRVINSGETWFVDFFSPHCPPCRQLIPELRIVSQNMPNIHFGTVDCTTHNALCNEQNVRSYPTSIMYNQSKPHMNAGFHRAAEIMDFIQDTLNPKVVHLDKPLFDSLVKNRKKNDIWLVDFFAPWCGPCQALAPEWRKLAKMLNGSANIGSVDCVANNDLCQELTVHSFPTIRLYPRGMAGIAGSSDYRGWNRDANSLLGWAFSFLPSIVEVITQSNFRSKVLRSEEPWILDFYSPWCGPCQQYMPQFEQIAKTLQGYVRAGKIDCSQWQSTCNQASIQSYPSVRLYKGTDTPGYSQNWYGEQIWNKAPPQLVPYLQQRFPNKYKSATVKDEL